MISSITSKATTPIDMRVQAYIITKLNINIIQILIHYFHTFFPEIVHKNPIFAVQVARKCNNRTYRLETLWKAAEMSEHKAFLSWSCRKERESNTDNCKKVDVMM